MREFGKKNGFGGKAFHVADVPSAQDLDRYDLVRFKIPRAVNRRHAAGDGEIFDFEATCNAHAWLHRDAWHSARCPYCNDVQLRTAILLKNRNSGRKSS
jgi:hypothetical protein